MLSDHVYTAAIQILRADRLPVIRMDDDELHLYVVEATDTSTYSQLHSTDRHRREGALIASIMAC